MNAIRAGFGFIEVATGLTVGSSVLWEWFTSYWGTSPWLLTLQIKSALELMRDEQVQKVTIHCPLQEKKSQCPEDSSYIGLQRFFQIFFFIIFTPLMSINQKYEFLEATLFYIWLINCFVLFFPAVNCKQFPNILLSIYASPAGCLCVFVLVALKFTRFKLCFLHAL